MDIVYIMYGVFKYTYPHKETGIRGLIEFCHGIWNHGINNMSLVREIRGWYKQNEFYGRPYKSVFPCKSVCVDSLCHQYSIKNF